MSEENATKEEMHKILDSFRNATQVNAIKILKNADFLIKNVDIGQPERYFDSTAIYSVIDTALNADKGNVELLKNALKIAKAYPATNGDNPSYQVMTLAARVNRDDENMAQNILNITKQNDSGNHISSDSLRIYIELVRNNPNNSGIACNILEDLISRERDFDSSYIGGYEIQSILIQYDFAYDLLKSMIKNNYKDEKFNQMALNYINKNIQKFQSSLDYRDKENQKRREDSLRRGRDYIPDFPYKDPRRFIISLAQNNVERPEFVEQCLELSKKFPKNYQEQLYDNLLEAGYKANNFEGRYNLKQAKKRVEKNIYRTKAMTADIKSGIAKTKESGYGYISKSDRRNEQKSQLNIKNMKDAKDSLAK